MSQPTYPRPGRPTQENIASIAKLEEEALERRTPAERASDSIVKLIGSTAFLLLHLLLVVTWAALNLNVIPRREGLRSVSVRHSGADCFVGERFPDHFRADQ